MLPTTEKTYTARQIETFLTLRDTPFYRFLFQGRLCVIQTSHISAADLLSVPGFADTLWRFQGETREWIPLFLFADPAPITDFVEIELDLNDEGEYWVTPKAFHRQQPVPTPTKPVAIQRSFIAPGRHFGARGKRSRHH
jgi:hypothetical protein